MSVEIGPDVIQKRNGKWNLTLPIAQSGGGLFAITSSWCGHCNQLKQTVPKAQKIIPFDFFWLDAEKTPSHEAKARQMDVKGYPTMYYIGRDGVLQEYNGGRSEQDLAQVFHRR